MAIHYSQTKCPNNNCEKTHGIHIFNGNIPAFSGIPDAQQIQVRIDLEPTQSGNFYVKLHICDLAP